MARAGLAQEPLDLVSLHRAADFAAHRKADTGRPLLPAGKGVQHQVAIGNRAALPIHPIELGAA